MGWVDKTRKTVKPHYLKLNRTLKKNPERYSRIYEINVTVHSGWDFQLTSTYPWYLKYLMFKIPKFDWITNWMMHTSSQNRDTKIWLNNNVNNSNIFAEEAGMLPVSGWVLVHQIAGVGQIEDPEGQRYPGVVRVILREYQELAQQVTQEVLVSLKRLFLHQLEELLL